MNKGTIAAITETQDYTMIVLTDNRILKSKWSKVPKNFENKEVIWSTYGDWDPNEWFNNVILSDTQQKLEDAQEAAKILQKQIKGLNDENNELQHVLKTEREETKAALSKQATQALVDAKGWDIVKDAKLATKHAEDKAKQAHTATAAAQRYAMACMTWVWLFGLATITMGMVLASMTYG